MEAQVQHICRIVDVPVFNKPLEYGRAADDTTSGLELLRMRTSLHDALERNVRAT